MHELDLREPRERGPGTLKLLGRGIQRMHLTRVPDPLGQPPGHPAVPATDVRDPLSHTDTRALAERT